MFKRFVQRKLESYVVEYFKKHPEVKLVAVAGSVGKTSTKMAIATVLSERYRVRLHDGNHNTHISAPLAILGIKYPEDLKEIKQWRAVFRAVKARINAPADVDVIVQELGSDRIGQTRHFGTYLKPDISVITAVSPEHMEYFMTMDNVAREELEVANFSKLVLINKEDIDGVYAKYIMHSNINTYGTNCTAEYNFATESYSIKDGHKGFMNAPEFLNPVPAEIHLLGEYTLRPAIAAAAVALKLGVNTYEMARGLAKIRALPGRMNLLRGIMGSLIIDDTYNSSPLAAISSLRELYKIPASQRIAVFGSMNELGELSKPEHKKLGELCNMNELAWVVTVGDDAQEFLAPAAKSKGCQVRSFKDALSASTFVKSVIQKDTVILFKGSEDKIFLEEAIKLMLHSTSDESQLVRQSPAWMARKNEFFSKFS